MARPLTLPNFVALRQQVCEVSAVENLSCWKSGSNFIKMGDDLLGTNAPHRAKCYRAAAKRCTRKALQIFYTLRYFGAPGGPPGPKFSNLGSDIQQRPLYQFAKFRLVLRTPVRDTYSCQILSISLTDKNSKGHNYLRIPCGDKKKK